MKQKWYCKGTITDKDKFHYTEVGEVGKPGICLGAAHPEIRMMLCSDEDGKFTDDMSLEQMLQDVHEFWLARTVTPVESEYLKGWRDFYGEFEVDEEFLRRDRTWDTPEHVKIIREAMREKYGESGRYCALCGNCCVEKHGDICPTCTPLVAYGGRLYRAYQLYQTAIHNHGKCCGGLMIGGAGFYFHGKDWEGNYRPYEDGESHLWCEMGINFFEAEAGTYYMWDIDHSCGSEEYGDLISYDDPEFWTKIMAQVDRAPEEMWNADWTSCPKCGYHVYAWADGVCPCEENEEEEDEDE